MPSKLIHSKDADYNGLLELINSISLFLFYKGLIVPPDSEL
jgi:hypothetical protein